MESLKFSLKEFEGSLELLLALIQKQELDLLNIPITNLTGQLGKSEAPIDSCADSMALTATLLLLKSRKLLPSEEQILLDEDDGQRMQLIEHLLTYCRLKEAAKELAEREKSEQIHFLREPPISQYQKGPGLSEVSLKILAERLQLVMDRKAALHDKVEDESWHVETALKSVRERLKCGPLRFEELLHEEMCQGELIVTFLALLELMKHGEITVGQEDEEWVVSATS